MPDPVHDEIDRDIATSPVLRPIKGRHEMKPVTSSNVARVGYDPQTRELRVDFVNGGSYVYFDVPQGSADALSAAESVGKHLATKIKPLHSCRRV